MRSLGSALVRARVCILIMAATYVVTVTAGAVMVQAGNAFALRTRDSIVSRAHRADPAARAQDAGSHGKAAAIDFARNFLATIPETVGGLTLVMPIALAAYRGWVGGIVSVDGAHRSRLRRMQSAVYYLVTLVLQLTGFSIAGGAGLYLGWAFFRKRGPFVGPDWFRLPRPALVDVARLYLLVVPAFAVGSLWEYFVPSG